ncbi:MAG TPA: LytR C-terminal domain-containing protein [Candidatus Saccharimonadales bacterium]|nr:LytR C-terminal domain-containing protein [Candidatus Saccharimonadales bacterium]
MQTRKRAKSVSFGKKEKEKPEKEEVKKVAAEHDEAEESTKTSEKAETVERRSVPDKPQSDELSATLSDVPPAEEEIEAPSLATPANEFISDNATPTTEQAPKEETPVEASTTATLSTPETPQPVETSPEVAAAVSAPEQSSQAATSAPDLSPTLPPSAFTIQNGGDEVAPTSKPEGEKKRFGIYFFVVAFLSFILGLGAMAAASYFGVINLALPNVSLPSGVHVPSFGAKPTATPVPPTPSPTEVPVDVSQYTIEILNGSGVTGQAGKVKDSLTADKFNVSSTGNAANNNFTKTEIAAKKSVSAAYITKLESELNKTFVVDTTVATLSNSATTDVTVTLGSSTPQ